MDENPVFRDTPNGSLEVLSNGVWTSVPGAAASAIRRLRAELGRSERPPMPLGRALSILAECFTATDHRVGFTVQTAPRLEPHMFRYDGEYIDAWKAVRHAIGLQIEPQDGGLQ